MLRSIWNSVSAMNAQQNKLNSISNNIANTGTVGYKSEDVNFQDLMYETLNRSGYPVNSKSTTPLISGEGSKTTEAIRNTAEGSLEQTNQKTDLAINGQGFFRVMLPGGKAAYERAGNFNVDKSGSLVDSNGNKVEIVRTNGNTSGQVLKNDNFIINDTGNVYIKNGNEDTLYGKINVYDAIGQDSMMSIGDSLYSPKQGTQVYQNNNASIEQGWLEQSNVDVGSEMTDMIQAQRAFELNSKALTTSDEMWGLINSMKSR